MKTMLNSVVTSTTKTHGFKLCSHDSVFY